MKPIFVKSKSGKKFDVEYYRPVMIKNCGRGNPINWGTPIGQRQDKSWFWFEGGNLLNLPVYFLAENSL